MSLSPMKASTHKKSKYFDAFTPCHKDLMSSEFREFYWCMYIQNKKVVKKCNRLEFLGL
jgi:hypothetical protein